MKCTDKTHNSINHCGHRELAMTLIESVIEGEYGSLDGEPYYDMEDKLTYCLAKNMKTCNGTAEKTNIVWKKVKK
jgi:hypothetical protein